ncbi:MAG: hypothetical protein LBI12_06460, partial [Treponema sp.]|nr:hypothetical protein [Treponema sp.]
MKKKFWAADKDNNQTKIHSKIFLVIVVTATVIIVCGLTVGGLFLNRSITDAIEADMLIAVDIADMYVSNEIELLKTRAAEAARIIRQYMKDGGSADILQRVCAEFPRYIGMAVFNETQILDSWGDLIVPPDLYKEPFMQIAFAGSSAVSTTMYTPDEKLVMYVSAYIGDGLVLAAVLPGLYFSDLVSMFTFWQSGHLFIDDEDGYIISNYRSEWVEQRLNFIELAKTDSSYIDVSLMVKRGIAGERGVGRFKMAGVPRICAFRPVSSPNENWFIGIVAPLSESALHNVPGGIVLIGMIALIMSIIAAFPASALLKKPYEEVARLCKAAEISSIAKTTFLANMSHEIRTPMNSILGFSELAQDDKISHKTRDYLNKIQTNAEWLLQIINDILDISKIESGKMELEQIPFDIHELFANCRTLIMPRAVEKGIILYFYAEPSIGKRPLGDPTKLRQIFINLLSNAIKFTHTGMVKLLADIKNTSNNTATIYFEVKDSGIGMTSEQINRIFDPFMQAESGTTRKFGGTGLGLPITKSMIELMGGELSVESTPGIGTKFSFTLTFST